MKKGAAWVETVGIIILLLVSFTIIAIIFTGMGNKILFLTKLAFMEERACEKTGLSFSSYQAKLTAAEEAMDKEVKSTPAYLGKRENLAMLYAEYEKCQFPEKIALGASSSLAIAQYFSAKGDPTASLPLYEAYLLQTSGKIPLEIRKEMYQQYRASGNHERAIATLQQITQEHSISKEGAAAKYKMGLYYETILQDVVKAKQAYQSLRANPDYGDLAAYSLAKIALEKESPPPYPEKLSSTEQKNAKDSIEKAESLLAQGKEDEALVQYATLFTKYRNTEEAIHAQYEVGFIYKQRKNDITHAVAEWGKIPPYGHYGVLAAFARAEGLLSIKNIHKETI